MSLLIKSRIIVSFSFGFENVVQSIVMSAFASVISRKKYCAFDAENPDNLRGGGTGGATCGKYNLIIYYILRAEVLIIF
jgi:hypothetical protein